MAKTMIGLTLIGLLFGPAACLMTLAVVANPAAEASCLPSSSPVVSQVPRQLTARLRDGTPMSLDHSQLQHAATIVTIGAQTPGVGRDGILIALMAGLTESQLEMLANPTAYPESVGYPHDGDGSDGDSLGIFQMRPTSGWGTIAQLMDPDYQARSFYGGPTGPNRGSPKGLLDIPGWQHLEKGAAAQAVEVSAYPDRYANSQPVAKAILDVLTGPPTPPRTPGPAPHTPSAGQSGTGRVLGQMPTVRATPGAPVHGPISIVNANLKYPHSTPTALRMIGRAARPDFITLNEIHRFEAPDLKRALAGYDAYKDPVALGGGARTQSMNNALMWRRDTWRLIDGGRVKIVEDDQTLFQGRRVRWDRFAIWGVFARIGDGAVVPVIATHHMTNVKKNTAQWGDPPLSRPQQYARGMDILIELAAMLGRFGPVLLGGDMNSHPGDGSFAAAPRMRAAGFNLTKDSGVMYQFFPTARVEVRAHREIAVPSDHPANTTTLEMNGAGPHDGPVPATPGSTTWGCGPCPTGPAPGSGLGEPGAAGGDPYHLGPVSPALARLVGILAPRFGIRSVGGYRPSALDPAGHPSGNAADFMVPSDSTDWATSIGKRTGDALAAFARAHAVELNVDYVIWWQRIWSLERASEGWRLMEDRGSNNQDHRNHVHINVLPHPPASGTADVCLPTLAGETRP